MKIDLKLAELLRYAFTGGMATLAYLVQCQTPGQLLQRDIDGPRISIALGVVLLVGITAQALHRAILYPFLLRLSHLLFCTRTTYDRGSWYNFYVPSKLEQTFDDARWRRRTAKESKSVQAALDGWADQIHFLYGSSVGVAIALLTRWLVVPCAGSGGLHWGWLAGLAGVLLLAAFIHDSRHMRTEERLSMPSPAASVATDSVTPDQK